MNEGIIDEKINKGKSKDECTQEERMKKTENAKRKAERRNLNVQLTPETDQQTLR